MGGSSYRFRDKIRPFCKGLLEGRPFRQIALEGLARVPEGPLQEKYIKRLARRGNAKEIHSVLGTGLKEEHQDMLADRMKKHFNNRVTYMLAVIAYERSEISRNSKELRMRLYQKQVESLA
ncbi:hypothetical protein GF318_05880, partial [Candidatus Micrarchaeota archaeon]|nr:hypothetical protein [Candidatus Micrarchaeota archaeon]